MHRFEVGKPLIEGKTHWPEVPDFNYYDAGYELRIYARYTSSELARLADGRCQGGD